MRQHVKIEYYVMKQFKDYIPTIVNFNDEQAKFPTVSLACERKLELDNREDKPDHVRYFVESKDVWS